MLLRRIFLALILLGSACGLAAQDLHYTLHNMSPLWLNPAKTGAFSGTVRAGITMRAQYLGTNGTNTPGAFADAPIIRGLRKQDWIGVGFTLISDQANAVGGDIVRNFSGFSAAYHLALDKKQTRILTLGAQYGNVSIGINPGLTFTDQNTISTDLGGFGTGMVEDLGGNTGTGTGGNNNNDGPRNSYTDINAGLVFRSQLDAKSGNNFEIGVAMMHINSDRYQTFASRQVDTMMMNPPPTPDVPENREVKPTLHAHANLDYRLSDNIRLMPTIFYQSSANNSSVSLQAWAGLELKEDMLFKFGLGYRTSNAGKILLGFEKDRLRIAASYDVVLSQQTPTFELGSLNSIELAANYIFNIYKKPKVKPSILCPRI